jgi:hypothetical protein
MKIHYASVERGNESNPYDEWSKTACGLDLESHLTNKIERITCKNCLNALRRHLKRYHNSPSQLKDNPGPDKLALSHSSIGWVEGEFTEVGIQNMIQFDEHSQYSVHNPDNPEPNRYKADRYFESQAYFNKWLKEMTATERVQITQMLAEFAIMTLESVLLTDDVGSFELSDGSRTLAVSINTIRAKIKELI